jgi:hypothetical protein
MATKCCVYVYVCMYVCMHMYVCISVSPSIPETGYVGHPV